MAFFSDRIGGSTTFGAFHGSELVGIAGLLIREGQKEAHKGLLVGMYVRPSARRAGVGRRLVETIIEFARHRVELIQLAVVSDNEQARRLYERLGFEELASETSVQICPIGFSAPLKLHPHPSLGKDHARHAALRLPFRRRKSLSVDVHRDLAVGMTQQLLHDSYIFTVHGGGLKKCDGRCATRPASRYQHAQQRAEDTASAPWQASIVALPMVTSCLGWRTPGNHRNFHPKLWSAWITP